jgi:hypothetical protein
MRPFPRSFSRSGDHALKWVEAVARRDWWIGLLQASKLMRVLRVIFVPIYSLSHHFSKTRIE